MSACVGVTDLLLEWNRGSARSREQLLALVFDQLRRLAGKQLGRERGDHTLQPTALVNEVYLRLVDHDRVNWQNRTQFFAVASELMRRVLVDHARRRLAAKRGGRATHIELDDAIGVSIENDHELVRLDDALQGLAQLDGRQAKVVELRFFGGLSIEEVSCVLEISVSTVKRDWHSAKAWLYHELRSGENYEP